MGAKTGISWTERTLCRYLYMAQTREGARKAAAKAAGLSVAEYNRNKDAGLSRCYRCKDWRENKHFTMDNDRSDGISRICRDCKSHKYRTTTGIGLLERRRQEEHGMFWCRRCSRWLAQLRFPKRYDGLCKKHQTLYNKEYYHSNPQPIIRRNNARQRNVDPVPIVGGKYLLDQFSNECAYCNAEPDTWDHVIPVCRGGQTEPGNIVPACRSCNSAKGKKDIYEWLKRCAAGKVAIVVDVLLLREVSLGC